MISSIEQDRLSQEINRVNGVIYFSSTSRKQAFEEAFPEFRQIGQNNIYPSTYRGRGLTWQVVRASDNARGYKPRLAIIDSFIDEEIYERVILPSLVVCSQVEFF